MIRTTLILAAYSLRRIRAILIGLGLVLALFQFLLTQVASYLLSRSAFAQLASLIPDFMRNIAGPSALAFLSFPGMVALGYFHPMIMTSLTMGPPETGLDCMRGQRRQRSSALTCLSSRFWDVAVATAVWAVRT